MEKQNSFLTDHTFKRTSVTNLFSKSSIKILNERRKSSINQKGINF